VGTWKLSYLICNSDALSQALHISSIGYSSELWLRPARQPESRSTSSYKASAMFDTITYFYSFINGLFCSSSSSSAPRYRSTCFLAHTLWSLTYFACSVSSDWIYGSTNTLLAWPASSYELADTISTSIKWYKQDWKAFQSSWERKKWQFFPSFQMMRHDFWHGLTNCYKFWQILMSKFDKFDMNWHHFTNYDMF